MIRPAQPIETDQVILTVVPDASVMSTMAADVVAETIRHKPDAAICLPTGSTPLGMFDVLLPGRQVESSTFHGSSCTAWTNMWA